MRHISSNASFRLVNLFHQALTFEVWRDNLSWACYVIYASLIPAQREFLWSHLTNLRSSIVSPWLLVGDFNEILHASETQGETFVHSRADRFSSMIASCKLVDLGVVGNKFTWFRKQKNRLIHSKRLDRGLGNVDWRLVFPDVVVQTLHRVHSDHCLLLVSCGADGSSHGDRPFRFIVAWVDHPDCHLLVENA